MMHKPIKNATFQSILVLKITTSKAMVNNKERPDQITIATLNEVPDNAFLKVNIPVNKKMIPATLFCQSVIPFDRVKKIFHAASLHAEMTSKKKPTFIVLTDFL